VVILIGPPGIRSERLVENAERLAGIALIPLGAGLLPQLVA
jgi:hypothetical protein